MRTQEERMLDLVEVEVSITCSQCKKTSKLRLVDDAEEAVEVFIREGWYATENFCFCKICNKNSKR